MDAGKMVDGGKKMMEKEENNSVDDCGVQPLGVLVEAAHASLELSRLSLAAAKATSDAVATIGQMVDEYQKSFDERCRKLEAAIRKMAADTEKSNYKKQLDDAALVDVGY